MKNQTKHCLYCDKCIDEFDHHCIWVHNCIGKNNIHYFLCFLIITFINLIFHFWIGYSVYNKDSILNSNAHNDILPHNFIFFNSVHSIRCFAALIMVVSLFFSIPVLIIIIFQLKNKLRTRKKGLYVGDKEKDKEEYEKLI
jgi:hypothetical protein